MSYFFVLSNACNLQDNRCETRIDEALKKHSNKFPNVFGGHLTSMNIPPPKFWYLVSWTYSKNFLVYWEETPYIRECPS